MNTTVLRTKLDLYERLMRLDKPIGTLLLLWPTLWALWIAAAGQPTWALIVIFSVGTLLMRSAGCVMNDLADAGYDRHVERTRNRPLATGAVTRGEAFALAGFLVLCSFALVLFLNRLTILLSVVALFLAATYPLTKRFLAVPQAYLGVAFGFGIPMATAAQLGGDAIACAARGQHSPGDRLRHRYAMVDATTCGSESGPRRSLDWAGAVMACYAAISRSRVSASPRPRMAVLRRLRCRRSLDGATTR
jgi:hypothetical protein